jgi:hypothetical protein
MKPATIGGVAYLGQNMFIDGKTIRIKGQEYPLALVASGAVALGSVFAEFAHEFVMPHIHFLDKLNSPASLALASGSTAMGNVGAYYLLNPKAIPALGVGNLALLGAMSEVVGDQIYSKVINPTLQNLM